MRIRLTQSVRAVCQLSASLTRLVGASTRFAELTCLIFGGISCPPPNITNISYSDPQFHLLCDPPDSTPRPFSLVLAYGELKNVGCCGHFTLSIHLLTGGVDLN